MPNRTKVLDPKQILNAIPGLHLFLYPGSDFLIIDATDDYFKVSMTQREEVIGKPFFDVFPENPETVEAKGTENVRSSLLQALTTKTEHSMPIQRYDLKIPGSDPIQFEQKYWKPKNTPVLNKKGEVEFIIHTVEDVTEIMKLKEAHVVLSQAKEDVEFERRKFYALFGQSPIGIAIVRSHDLVFDYANSSFRNLLLCNDLLDGFPLRVVFEHLGDTVLDQAAAAFERRERISIDEISLRFENTHLRTLHLVFEPFKTQQGSIDGLMIFALDISEFSRARTEVSGTMQAELLDWKKREIEINDTVLQLRNCMSIIHLDAKIIREEAHLDSVKDHASKLMSSCDRVNSLLTRISKH